MHSLHIILIFSEEYDKGIHSQRTCSLLLWKYCRFRYEKMWNSKGLVVDEKEIKLTSFADDLTTFLKDMDSLHKLLHKAFR